jgi:hypothetical protein
VLTIWVAIALAANLWAGMPQWGGGFVAGLFVASIPLLLLQIDVTYGIATRQMGYDAELWTAEALRRLRLSGWRFAHDVRFEWFNIDHVAFGPKRVLVIETKWLGAQRDLQRAVLEAADQAERGAKKIKNLLRSTPPEDRVVDPVIVLWGPGAPREGVPSPVNGVEVICAGQRGAWVRTLGQERGRPDRQAHKAVKDYQRRSTVPAPPAQLAPRGQGSPVRRSA